MKRTSTEADLVPCPADFRTPSGGSVDTAVTPATMTPMRQAYLEQQRDRWRLRVDAVTAKREDVRQITIGATVDEQYLAADYEVVNDQENGFD